MYPQSELTGLAARKARLRHSIHRRRGECVRAASRVAQPLAWLDRVRGFCRRYAALAPLVAVPIGLLARRTVWPRLKFAGALIKWAPLLIDAVRRIGASDGNRW